MSETIDFWKKKAELLEARVNELEQIVQSQAQSLQEYEQALDASRQRIESFLVQMRKDLQTLKQLQQSLVPKQLPMIKGIHVSSRFIAGSRQGGDYYDLYPIGRGTRFGVILSSCGHFGLSATILSLLMAHAPRSEEGNFHDIEGFVRKLFEQARPHMKEGDEWHLLFGVCDMARLSFDYLLFGDLEAGVWSPAEKEGATLSLFKKTAGPLTASSEWAEGWQSQQVVMHPRDVWWGTSLGFSQVGVPAVHTVFKDPPASDDVHDIRNHIFKFVREAQSSMTPERDQTVLVWSIQPQVMRVVPSE